MTSAVPLTKPATTRDWKAACAVAHARLCAGSHGVQVEAGESWLSAIGRVAGQLLQSHGYGRGAPGKKNIPDEWPRILAEIASKGSTAPDALVQRAGMRVPLGSFPRWAT